MESRLSNVSSIVCRMLPDWPLASISDLREKRSKGESDLRGDEGHCLCVCCK